MRSIVARRPTLPDSVPGLVFTVFLVAAGWAGYASREEKEIGDGIVPHNLDLSLMDGVVTASTGEALEMALRLAREEAILCGPSSGMNVAAALKVRDKHPEFATIVTVVPDTGQRYLSGELFGERSDEASPERDHAVDPESLEQIEANRDRLEFIS